MCIDINALSLSLDLNIFQQDEYSGSKLGMEVEYAKSSKKKILSQIWVICELLPFVMVGQYSTTTNITFLPLIFLVLCVSSGCTGHHADDS